jgi:predicted nucleic acid-binding protein
LSGEYEYLKPDLADLSLVIAAEREGIADIVTLDERDFRRYQFEVKKGKKRHFKLIPF